MELVRALFGLGVIGVLLEYACFARKQKRKRRETSYLQLWRQTHAVGYSLPLGEKADIGSCLTDMIILDRYPGRETAKRSHAPLRATSAERP